LCQQFYKTNIKTRFCETTGSGLDIVDCLLEMDYICRHYQSITICFYVAENGCVRSGNIHGGPKASE